MRLAPVFLLLCCTARAEEPAGAPLGVTDKLRLHAEQIANPGFAVEKAAYAGLRQWMDSPREWGQGASAYGKRLASTAGASAIRSAFAFALDSTLREDPRYLRSGHGGFLARIGHAARETAVTRTGSGHTRLATWRFGSAMGAAWLSHAWYPDRLNTFSSRIEHGAATLGGDLLGNVASEFWPDVKHIVFRRH